MLGKMSIHFGVLFLLAIAMVTNFIYTHDKNAFRATEAISLNLHDLYCTPELDQLKQENCMVSVEGNPSEAYVLNSEMCGALY